MCQGLAVHEVILLRFLNMLLGADAALRCYADPHNGFQ